MKKPIMHHVMLSRFAVCAAAVKCFFLKLRSKKNTTEKVAFISFDINKFECEYEVAKNRILNGESVESVTTPLN